MKDTPMDVDAELAGLASLAEETAAEVEAASAELAEADKPAPIETDSAPTAESDAPSVTPEPEPPAATQVAEPAASDEPDESARDSAAATASEADAPPSESEREIENFLETAAAGKDSVPAAPKTKLVFKATPSKKPEAESAPDKSDTPDAPPKESKEKQVRARLIAVLAEKLEVILAKLDAPVAGLRDEIKAIIGYLALGTLVMAVITWVIAFFR